MQVLAGLPALKATFSNVSHMQQAELLREDVSGIRRALLVKAVISRLQASSAPFHMVNLVLCQTPREGEPSRKAIAQSM